MKADNTESTYTDQNDQTNEEPLIGVDIKLADLMQKGWTMLAESCPLESCSCPLMRSIDGQKYCVNCEMWHYDNQRKKQKFELVSLQGKQTLQVKRTEVSTLPKNRFNFTPMNLSVIGSLNMKLEYLAKILNQENDIDKTKEILECMRICMQNIETAKVLGNN